MYNVLYNILYKIIIALVFSRKYYDNDAMFYECLVRFVDFFWPFKVFEFKLVLSKTIKCTDFDHTFF